MVKVKYFLSIICVLLASICFIAPTDAFANTSKNTKTRISTDRSNIIAGTDFNLFVEVTTPRKLNKSDLKYKPLTKLFRLGNVSFEKSQSKGLNIYRWRLPLIRNEAGVVKVPSLSISSNLTTPTFELNVKKVEGMRSKKIVKSMLRNKTLIAGQLALYRVEINLRPDIKVETVSAPIAKGGKVQLLAEKVVNRASPNSNYIFKTRIQEYKIIFPKAGEHVIKPPVVTGINRTTNKKFMETGKDITVNVAKNNSGAIVSDNLNVVVKWTPEDSDITVGQPISREITIRGTNNALSQLPQIILPHVESFDSYEDRTIETEKLMRNKKLIATKVIKHTFIPKQNHTSFTLDDIKIKWINPNDNTTHEAVIPGITYTVDGFSFNDYIPKDPRYTYWIVFGLTIFVLALIGLYFSYIAYRRRRGVFGWLHLKVDHATYWLSLSKNWSNLDPYKSRKALLEWAQKRWPEENIVGLHDLPFYNDIKQEVDELSAACWSKEAGKWKGNALYRKLAKNKNYERPKLKHGINPYGINGEIFQTVKQKLN